MTHTVLSNRSVRRRDFVCMAAAGTAAMALMSGLPTFARAQEAGAYTPGTYTATGTGKGGDVVVEVEFDETSIKSVDVVSHNETRYVSDVALETIPAQIVEYQSLNIDSVSGATLTSHAILSAVTDCVEQAGGDVKALEEAPGTPKEEKDVELEADLVVVGAGGAGMTAAMAAAQAGKQVVVLEKTSNMGGNAVVCGGYIHYIHAPQELRQPMTEGYAEYFDNMLQRGLDEGAEQGITPEFIEGIRKDYDEYYAAGNTTLFDSEEFCALEYQFTNGGTFDKWVNFIYTVPAMNEWLTELGIQWFPLTNIAGFPWPRWSGQEGAVEGQGYFDLYRKVMDEQGLPITMLTCTPATELVVEDGKVVGVVGECTDGTTYTVRSGNGVVLATGGYSGNFEMLKKYNTYWNFDGVDHLLHDNTSGHEGDGITLAQTLGAQVDFMGKPMMIPFGSPTGSTAPMVGNHLNFMLVNGDGKRIVNEKASRYDISQALFSSKDATGYIVSDSTNCNVIDGKAYGYYDVNYLAANHDLYFADTLEELAEAIGADPETLIATVNQFNEYCRAADGQPDEFGRTIFTEEGLIEEGPFYASPISPRAHLTPGGILIDEEDYCALNENNERIEGLHCVGELAAERSGMPSLATGLYTVRKIFGLE